MSTIETVKIKDGTGFCWINKDDYNPDIHQIFGLKETPVVPQKTGAGKTNTKQNKKR